MTHFTIEHAKISDADAEVIAAHWRSAASMSTKTRILGQQSGRNGESKELSRVDDDIEV